MEFRPRPKQAEVLAYRSGRMGVAAVPGSGKTHTLSYLAANLVAEADLEDDQEVLVVTLVNSAVDNFARRVGAFVRERDLLPNVGYRVRTLHGIAHDIVRERPALVGLSEDFQIADERASFEILTDAADAWVRGHPFAGDDFLDMALDERKLDWVRRNHWPRLVSDLAGSFIRLAKDRMMSPGQLREKLDQIEQPEPLLDMACAIYADYQRALSYRNAVDYDDLIRLALLALRADRDYLARLQHRWPYVLEDEAQDSSDLQERILALLTGASGNWVRVGDPNQAIFETFTTASPQFLRNFLATKGVQRRELPNSGRSTQSIIDLANHLIEWSRRSHPVMAVRDALGPPLILPAPEDDPQPNPDDAPAGIFLMDRGYSSEEEIDVVAKSLQRWLPEHPDSTVAVLAPRNDRGELVVAQLRRLGIDCVELLRSSRETRETAGALTLVLTCLAEPTDPARLARAYEVWRRADREDEVAKKRLAIVAKAIRRCGHVEEFLWPAPGSEAPGKDVPDLPCVDLADGDELAVEQLLAFRELVRRWQGAAVLPIDQLVLTLAMDLFDRYGKPERRAADLALSYKLAALLRSAAEAHPEWRLPELARELEVIARNERKFLGFSDDETGFDPEKHRGKVVVATAHKAKGLEWDRVYLLSANTYDFPSGMDGDAFIGEKWFLAGQRNLEAEVLDNLGALLSAERPELFAPVDPAKSAQDARAAYASERLRLFYVAITRARRELIVTWNTGRTSERLQPAVPLVALQEYWKNRE